MEYLKDIIDYGIIGLLALMSFLVIFFWIERVIFFSSIKLEKYSCFDELELDLTNSTSIIASFASNAPYIGLLGTVLGIIVTFYTMGQSGDINIKAIITSLALALKSTAMGLFVAIPAIFAYNHLTRKIEVIIAKWQILQKNK